MTCSSAIPTLSGIIQDQDGKTAEFLLQHRVGGGCYMMPRKSGLPRRRASDSTFQLNHIAEKPVSASSSIRLAVKRHHRPQHPTVAREPWRVRRRARLAGVD